MKKSIITLWVAFGTLLIITSCKKGLFDVTEDFYLSSTIIVDGNNAAFDADVLLNAIADNDMIDKYASHIKSIEITEVRYYVSYFNGSMNQQINNGTLSCADENGNNKFAIATISNVNLSNATSETTLPFDANAIASLSDLIKNDPHNAMLYLSGDVNETPIDFSVVFKFKVKMVASAL